MRTVAVLLFLLVCPAVCLHSKTNTVAIICTNDIHGSAFPYEIIRADTGEKYLYGGLEYMAQMIETLKQEYAGNVLYLDAGD